MSELLKINVNEHTEKKGALTYLSWAWAWAEVLKIDPKATWHVVCASNDQGVEYPCTFMPDGTAMVHVRVEIANSAKHCWLPVMDNRNNAVKNPDARKISDAIMRCMTKAIAMHGLGLYIYAGEDLPESDKADDAPNGVDPNTDEVTYAPRSEKVPKPNHPGVASMVTESEAADLKPETIRYLCDLASEIKDSFKPANGASSLSKDEFERVAKIASDRIELEKLDIGETMYLTMQLPTPMQRAIKAASVAKHRVGMPA